MSAQVTCPVCKTKYTVADNLLGKTIPCRKCQESFVATPVDDVPTVLAVTDDEPPPVRAAGNPLLLILLGAGAAVVLLGMLGVAAYLLWPEERTPVVTQAPPPPAAPVSRSRPSRPQPPPAPKEQPKDESPSKPVPADAQRDVVLERAVIDLRSAVQAAGADRLLARSRRPGVGREKDLVRAVLRGDGFPALGRLGLVRLVVAAGGGRGCQDDE